MFLNRREWMRMSGILNYARRILFMYVLKNLREGIG